MATVTPTVFRNPYKPGVLLIGHRQTEKPQSGVPPGAFLFAYMNFMKNEITPDVPKMKMDSSVL